MSGEKEKALLDAVYKDDAAEIARLIADGAAMNKADSDGLTPLHYAFKLYKEDAIATLVEYWSNPTLKCPNQVDNPALESELFNEVANGNSDKVELLLVRGVNVNARNAFGATPLHVAVFHNKESVVSLLCSRGASVDAQDEQLFTPLHWAVLKRYSSVVDELLKFQPDLTLCSWLGCTASQLVQPHQAESSSSDIASKIEAAKASQAKRKKFENAMLFSFARRRQWYLFELSIQSGFDVNAKEENGWMPIHHAVFNKNHMLVVMLCKYASDVNAELDKGSDYYSQTPLDIAVERGHLSIVMLLLGKSVQPTVQDRTVEKALKRAKLSENSGNTEKTEIKRLLEEEHRKRTEQNRTQHLAYTGSYEQTTNTLEQECIQQADVAAMALATSNSFTMAHSAQSPSAADGDKQKETTKPIAKPEVNSTFDELPELFLCPITLERIQDPVICELDPPESRRVYERGAIKAWLEQKKRSVIGNIPLGDRAIADVIKPAPFKCRDAAEQRARQAELELAAAALPNSLALTPSRQTQAATNGVDKQSTEQRVQQGDADLALAIQNSLALTPSRQTQAATSGGDKQSTTAPETTKTQTPAVSVDELPELFICPITLSTINDAVLCTLDGRIYEKSDIEQWLRQKRTSPVNRAALGAKSIQDVLIPVHSFSGARIWVESAQAQFKQQPPEKEQPTKSEQPPERQQNSQPMSRL